MLDQTGRMSVSIAAPLACASIVVGSIQLTGLGLKLTSMIVHMANGQLWIAMLLTMIITIILGMGLPTPAAYLLVAIFAPSALSQFGVPALTSHMFCFYYAAFSTITPPVAMAAYAGGNLAGANVNKTGFTAMKLGIAAYIIPWIFTFSSALFLEGSAFTIIQAVITALVGIYALAGGVPADTGKIIGGGPMMGRAMDHIEEMPANKRLSGLLFLPEAESIRPEEDNCIRCGKCVQACPMGLEPFLLQRLSQLEMWEECEKHDVMDCIDCGCCVYTCPAHRRLLDGIRPAKAKVGAILRERAAAAKK